MAAPPIPVTSPGGPDTPEGPIILPANCAVVTSTVVCLDWLQLRKGLLDSLAVWGTITGNDKSDRVKLDSFYKATRDKFAKLLSTGSVDAPAAMKN